MTKSDSSVSGNVAEGRWCCELDRVLIGVIAQVTEGLCREFVASRGVLRLDSSGGAPCGGVPFFALESVIAEFGNGKLT